MLGMGVLGRFSTLWGVFGKEPMGSKSKLEQAIEAQTSTMNDAQRELVRSQLSVYKRNNARLSQIESELAALNARPTATLDEVRLKQSQRMTLTYEHNQLTTANSSIAAELFKFMEE